MRFRRLVVLAVPIAALLTTGAQCAGASPLYGVTIDKIAKTPRIVEALGALPERPTTRVYLEPHRDASYYASALAQIHTVGGVMGELLDSSDEKSLSTDAYQ